LVLTDFYKARFPFKNGHVSTIYPSLFRKPINLNFERKRINTPDNDFLDVDVLSKGSSKALILCHGLEGSSASKYISGTADLASQSNWDCIAMNYRGCSGEMNKQLRMYHSGATDDIDTVINHFADKYSEIHLVGFSLGGNLVLKYCGERQLIDKVRSVVAISVPTDLRIGSMLLSKKSNFIYTANFLKSLKSKLHQKHQQYSDKIDLDKLKLVKTVYDFDEHFTGPIHGFKDAVDYYTQCSSAQFIENIKIPGLIINAKDDPIVPVSTMPFKQVKANKNMSLIPTQFGGHVGFIQKGKKYCWEEERIVEFINKNTEVPH